MKKRIMTITTVCIMFMALMLTLSGCSSSKVSGKFVNQVDDSQYFEFKGSRTVIVHTGSEKLSGKYSLSGNMLNIMLDLGDEAFDETLFISDGKDVITDGNIIMVKAASMPLGRKLLIVFIVCTVISIIYKVITKRDLSDDIDKLEEKFLDL